MAMAINDNNGDEKSLYKPYKLPITFRRKIHIRLGLVRLGYTAMNHILKRIVLKQNIIVYINRSFVLCFPLPRMRRLKYVLHESGHQLLFYAVPTAIFVFKSINIIFCFV